MSFVVWGEWKRLWYLLLLEPFFGGSGGGSGGDVSIEERVYVFTILIFK